MAVGIFAFAIVGVLGLLSPTGRAISDVADNDAASRAIGAIQAGLQRAYSGQTTGFTSLASRFSTNPNAPTYSLFANKSAERMGDSSLIAPADRFFEIALIRDSALSPASNDANAGFLAFTIQLRWPAYLPNGTQVPDSQKSSLVVPAAITR